jgi:phosphatidylinositol-3-phosphatase
MNRILKSFAVLICSLCFGASWASAQAPAATSTTLPAFGHVVIVLGENSTFGQTYNSGAMPYLDSLANKYGLSINYWADTHPSIGNYLNISGGNILTNDDSQTPSSFPVSGESIAKALENASKTWKDYEESTNGCGAVKNGKYIVRHDPLRYYTDINTESANFVCMSTFDSDVSAHTLPNLSWLAPNGCDDAHDCSLGTFDNFLKTEITPLLSSSYFQTGGDGLLIVTFDEDDGSGSPSCSTLTSGKGCGGQVETVVVSPQSKLAYQSTAGDSHNFNGTYEEANILATIALGLGASASGLGATGTAVPMADFFSATTSGSVFLNPTSLSFGSVTDGTSASQNVTLNNTTSSSVSVNISGIAISPTGTPFTVANSAANPCPLSLLAGKNCTLIVTFAPTTVASFTATLDVPAGGTTLTASLSGSGVSSSTGSTPAVTLSATSLNFHHVAAGTTKTLTVTVTNSGGSTSLLTVSSIAAATNPPFSETNTCMAGSLGVGKSCMISVTFSPPTSSKGLQTGTLTITDNASPTTQTVSLSGRD